MIPSIHITRYIPHAGLLRPILVLRNGPDPVLVSLVADSILVGRDGGALRMRHVNAGAIVKVPREHAARFVDAGLARWPEVAA